MYKFVVLVLVALFATTAAPAQRAEVTISLNEALFDALLESVFQNYDPPQFPIAQAAGVRQQNIIDASFRPAAQRTPVCNQAVTILREMNGVRTAVRFREGKVYVPLAFSGNYDPPFVGCVEFAGWAEANIDLEFDQAGQRLIGRARVLDVNLNGAGGLGGTVIARMVQASIDKRLNPIEIVRLDSLSFGVPIKDRGTLRMKAVSARPEIANGALNIRVGYVFEKG